MIPSLSTKIFKKRESMISFCCRSFHSLLGYPDSDDRRHAPDRWHRLLPPPDRGGLHLLAAADSPKPPHVVESPAVGPAVGGKSSDPGAWGLHEAAAVGVGGLRLCTESLGCESFEGGTEIDGEEVAAAIGGHSARRPLRRRRAEVRFPPPLPWLMGRSGRRCRFLRAERRDGRFVLTEVRIHSPPEMLRAFRIDGRLRLELIRSDPKGGEDLSAIAGGREEFPVIAEEEDFPAIVVEDGSDSEENGGRLELPPVRGEGHRCVEAMSGNGEPLWWNHRFVTTA